MARRYFDERAGGAVVCCPAHRSDRNQAIAPPADPQARHRQVRQVAAQVGRPQDAEALFEHLQRRIAAFEYMRLEFAQLVVGLSRSERLQSEKALDRRTIVFGQPGAELDEDVRRHAVRPVRRRDEARRCGNFHNAAYPLRRRQCRAQADQAAERPADPERARDASRNLRGAGCRIDRLGRGGAVAMAGQVDDVQPEVRREQRRQRCEDAAVHGPAMDQHEIRTAAAGFEVHVSLRSARARPHEPAR